MYDEQSLSHTKWDCKYHVIWIPKYRKSLLHNEQLAELRASRSL